MGVRAKGGPGWEGLLNGISISSLRRRFQNIKRICPKIIFKEPLPKTVNVVNVIDNFQKKNLIKEQVLSQLKWILFHIHVCQIAFPCSNKCKSLLEVHKGVKAFNWTLASETLINSLHSFQPLINIITLCIHFNH